MKVELFTPQDAARLAEAIAVRVAVFVHEQAVPLELELDEHDRADADAVHALARDDDGVLGTGRLYARDAQTAQIGRMAVLRTVRGCGVGAALLRALMEEAQRRGYRAAVLDAQQHAVGFYEKSGFIAEGPTHLDAGIVHQPMRCVFP
jgi:predicted GNAT family N-acyltransferase